MLEVTATQLFIFITIIWIIVRAIVNLKSKKFSWKEELKMLLVYVCIVVISRFVYFGFHLVNGRLSTLKIGLPDNVGDMVSLKPFFFLVDRYRGWQMNIIGNIAMFIPVGIVWPICFKKLNTFWKTVLAGFGYTLFIELTQLFCTQRHSDVDDLILNTAGAVIGAAIVFAIRKCRKKKQTRN